MVPTAKRTRFLQWQDIGRLLDNTKELHRAGRIRADVAKLVGGEVTTQLAGMDPLSRFRDGASDLFRLIPTSLHDPERDPFSRARTNTWHLPKLRNQIPQRGWIFRFSQGPSPGLRLPHRYFSEIERERLQATEIQLQRCIFLFVRPARFLKFGIRLGPAFLSIEYNTVPETIASCQLFGLRFRCRPKRLINLVPLTRIHTAQKINRASDDISARQVERARPNQNSRTIKPVCNTETAREFDRLATGDQSRTCAVLKWCDDHGSGTDTDVHVAFRVAISELRLPKLFNHLESNANRFVAMMSVDFGKAKQCDDAFGIGGLNVGPRIHERVGRPAYKFFRDFAEHRRLAVVRQIVLVGNVT